MVAAGEYSACTAPNVRATVATMADDSFFLDGVDVSVTGEPDVADVNAVEARLFAYNAQIVGMGNAVPVAALARRGEALIGGATGFTLWGWLFINYLWVSDELRGLGLGTDLLGKAEAVARGRGCLAVWLYTFSFQSPGFYERLGYRQFGRLEDFPQGHARYFLWKPL